MKKPGLLLSIATLLVLMALLALSVIFFGDEATSGPIQIALLLSTLLTAAIAILFLKVPWTKVEEDITDNIRQTAPTLLILLAIGALTATWMLSGIVPTMIYYGLKIISPRFFILITFLLCSLVSILAGSSWTTVGTIGVAMLTAGKLIGLPVGWLAGAIISGAYLGDKLSPLSDAVNLSATVAGSDLYKYIRYSLYTLVPAFVICFAVYLIVGLTVPVTAEVDMTAELTALSGSFHISPWLLLIPCLTIFMVVKKVPAFITLFISAIVGALVAFWMQPQIVLQITGEGSGLGNAITAIFKMLSSPIAVSTGNPLLDNLTSTHGMSGMTSTIWLVICIMAAGGALAGSGMLETITNALIKLIRGAGSLIATTVGTCIVSNMILSDQYMAILLPGKMFAPTYKKLGYAPELLSRTLGDSATVTSVLVPWNTCAVIQSTVLGVATMVYFPFAIFCLITPVIAILIAAFNFKIHRIE
ncbi:MAG: sodium:proton antiporter [Bacteroidales bacterium]|nr:sodium:proton antiporter [Bacteroidales bacterium]